jgi:hypothetical protein
VSVLRAATQHDSPVGLRHPRPVIVPLLQLVNPEMVTMELPPNEPEEMPSVLALAPPYC